MKISLKEIFHHFKFLKYSIQMKRNFEHFSFQQNVGDLLIVLHSVWIMGWWCWWFLSLMKANVIVHFRNHTFFLFTQPLEKFCRLSIKKLVTNSKSTMWCGFSKFTHVRTISKPYFFLHLIQKMIDIRADEFLKTCSAIVFLGGAGGSIFFFFKYIL